MGDVAPECLVGNVHRAIQVQRGSGFHLPQIRILEKKVTVLKYYFRKIIMLKAIIQIWILCTTSIIFSALFSPEVILCCYRSIKAAKIIASKPPDLFFDSLLETFSVLV